MTAFHESDLTDDARAENSATYCPEDNKLRIYCGRLERDSFEHLRRLGFKSTPKQSCAFVATWSTGAEDAALELIPDGADIDDEQYSPEERAADRAERFANYRDKRRTEAQSAADSYDSGPNAIGFQNQRRADRAADRHERKRTFALSQWSKAEYWQARTAGVIANALYKSDPQVRRGRILRLEAEQRDLARRMGSDCQSEHHQRWADHYAFRLEYERAMLANEGGTAGAVDMQPGGFIGRHQLHKVNRSPVTGAVVSIAVMGPKANHRGPGPAPMVLQTINIQRLGADIGYRPPTPEELVEFEAAKKSAKKSKPKAPSLINPDRESAERLQAIWNTGRKVPSEVWEMTQAQYSARNCSYGPCETVTITELGQIQSTHHVHGRSAGLVPVFKVRKGFGGGDFGAAYRVVVLTDKPQKPIPWADMERARESCPQADDLRGRLLELVEYLPRRISSRNPESEQLVIAAEYLGWLSVLSLSQYSWTSAGNAELAAARELVK